MPPNPRLGSSEITNGQRALWVFVIASFLAPAIAAIFIFLASMAAGLFGFGPPSLQGLAPARLAAIATERAILAYVWAVIPASLAGAGLAALVMLNGTVGWLAAAVAGVVAFAAMAAFAGGQIANHLTVLAALSGLVAVAIRAVLLRIGILKK
jgi:hypothetical protein